MREKVLVVFGTRPEAVKMAPVVHALETSAALQPVVCVTAQHRDMLDQVLAIFDIRPHHDLDLMRPNQRLDELTSRVLLAMTRVIEEEAPAAVLVHGDTTTTFAAALAAFYLRVPVGHVEAGLRSHDLTQPFPEEMNRQLADRLCAFHYAPTRQAAANLAREGIDGRDVLVTGNTVIDGILEALPRARLVEVERLPPAAPGIRRLLVTAHRRESFGPTFEAMCHALRDVVDAHPDTEIVYPVHLNPNVQRPVRAILGDHPRVHLLPPLSYLPFLRLMSECYLVLTDSGGIQEEAPSLAKPVLVMREVTERMEGVDAGVLRLVGTSREGIVGAATELLTDPAAYGAMATAANPFGDGRAAERIVSHLERALRPPTAAVPLRDRESAPGQHRDVPAALVG